MGKSMIAAQLYTVREFMKTPADIAKSLKKVRALGYEAVQLSGHGEVSDKELKKMVDDAYHDTESPDAKFTCDQCGKPMFIRKSNYGYFLGCSGYNAKKKDSCRNIIPCEMVDSKVVPIDKS